MTQNKQTDTCILYGCGLSCLCHMVIPEPQVVNKDYRPTPFLFNINISTLGLSGFKKSLMKKILFPMFVLIGCLCFSQTVTKKYNQYDRRYDYRDSYGNLVGYEKYNDYSKQWEYYSLNNSQQRQPYQYKDPQQLDISNLGNATTTLQNRYNNNQRSAQAVVDDIVYQIKSLNMSDSKKNQILNDFTKTVNANMRAISNGNVNWLYNAANTIIANASE